MVAIPGRARQDRAMQLFQPSQLPAAADIARHHHREPYATVVLNGAYEEAGDAGRVAAEAGEVMLQDRESGVAGKGVAGRVEPGCRRVINRKNKTHREKKGKQK